MAELHEILAERVAGWRASGYAHDAHPAIAEILHFARHEDGVPRYLREPQIRALETYWYLRLEEGTARIENLYLGLFQGREVLQALGIGGEEMLGAALDAGGTVQLLDRIKTDDDFVRHHAGRGGAGRPQPGRGHRLAGGAGTCPARPRPRAIPLPGLTITMWLMLPATDHGRLGSGLCVAGRPSSESRIATV